MGSNFNFKNFEQVPMDGDGSGGFSFPLTRQSSVYSLTFDEFQSAVGATGKDFGSMNMDELLKNIWSAEENQNIGSTSGLISTGGQELGGSLHRQGSLILPRTLSLKTVDEAWKDMSKEYIGGTDLSGGISGFSVSQRQPTLGQMTLEEFLMRAGAVREATGSRLDGNSNIVASLNDLTPPLSSNLEFRFGYQSANASGGLISGGGIGETSIQMATQSGNLPLSVNGVRYSAYEFGNQQQQQQFLPKQPALAYTAQMAVPSNSQLSSPGIGGGMIGITDPSTVIQNTTLQGGRLGILCLGANSVNIETGSPAVSTDGFTKVNGDASSVSPVPYVFNGGLRGRKVGSVEKIVERRHRRMIKNRESAARSRERKQAYTMELEAEVAKLKEENQGLQKKQVGMIEIQKNQALETTKQLKNGSKRRCLRRTCTGP